MKVTSLAGLCLLLSLAGARLYAGETDALALDANLTARHMPFGTVLDPMFASPQSDQIAGYTRCGDSAIWTGHYLAAEAFRYNVTRSTSALANVRAAIAGLKSLADVTGTNLLARCLVPANSTFAAGIASEEAHNGIYTNSSAGYIWVGNTSRDQYSGAIFGLAVAYDLVDAADVRSSASQLVTRLVAFLQGHDWNVVMPDGSTSTTFLIRPDQMLAFLQAARHVNPDQFSTSYDVARVTLSLSVSAPIAIEVTSDSSYSKFNLDYINLYNLIRLESSSAQSLYQGAYDILRNHTAAHQNAFFNMIDRALNGPNAARDTETLELLAAWLLRPRRDPFVDLSNTVPVCNGQACQPIPVQLRVPTDFLWQRNPFQLSGGGSSTIESSGIDYILPYWMARYYGVGQAFAVQSAAAAVRVVAPDSIASLYGSNLAGQTAQATAQPLPAILGGVSLTVHDVNGVDRPAPLIYVSPAQINFIVPAGTAPGDATLIVNNGSASQAAAATIQNVAPSIFTMNQQGTGVAAATAVRVQVSNPQVQFPVTVFACDSSGCHSVPIDVGVDTPVYLTLYGTGIRHVSSLSKVSVTINGISVPVLFAGAQPSFAGLDQINVPLTLNLRGSGESNVVVTVAGQVANTVTIAIQ